MITTHHLEALRETIDYHSTVASNSRSQATKLRAVSDPHGIAGAHDAADKFHGSISQTLEELHHALTAEAH